MSRRLRIIASYVCLALCLGLIASWADSYRSMSLLSLRFTPPWSPHSTRKQYDGSTLAIWKRREATGNMLHGQMSFSATSFTSSHTSVECRLRRLPITSVRGDPHLFGLDFDVYFSPESWRVEMPHWPPVLAAGLLAVALRPSPRRRFSLRDLFLVTTILAATLGSLAAVSQLST